MRTFFFQIRGRERKNDSFILLFRRLIAGMTYCGADTIARFLNRLISKADDRKIMQSASEIGFNNDHFRARTDRLRGERFRISVFGIANLMRFLCRSRALHYKCFMQVVAAGSASRRSSVIASPHTSHFPYVFFQSEKVQQE